MIIDELLQLELILVNTNDEPVGTMEKMQAHQLGVLHRAFSVFIFNKEGEMLLQQRAENKYHSGGLWTNACCSHPSVGEDTETAAARRLREEMGFSTKLHKAFSFIYKAHFQNGLTEHEFDHVFTGTYAGGVNPDPAEVSAYKFVPLDALQKDLAENPDSYTAWFQIAVPRLIQYLAG